MYIACSNGHDKVVQILLDHGAQVDVPENVSNISCITVKLCNTTEVNKATLVTNECVIVFLECIKCLLK